MGRGGAIIVMAVVASVGLGAFYLIGSGALGSPGATFTPGGYQYSAAAGSVGGLQLVVSANATSVVSGRSIAIAVQEYNPSRSAVGEPAAQEWRSRNVEIGFGCAFQNMPIGLAVFRGYYSTDNLSQALPLQMVDLGSVGSCPPVWTVHSWLFEASSDEVELVGCLGSTCVSSGDLVSTLQAFTVSGTWPSTAGNSSFAPFTPGSYTVAAGDEWGAVTLIHFTVVPP